MPTSENFKRVIVSLIGVPLIFICSYLGGYYFFAFVSSIALLSFYEFSLLVKQKGAKSNLFLGCLIIFVFLLNQFFNLIDPIVLIVVSSLLLLTVELFRNNGSPILNLGSTLLGIFYIGIFSASLISLREFFPAGDEFNRNGAYLLISIFASIWLGDSAAYYGGINFGRHNLFPRVSTKKTWEGAIFGFTFSVATMLLAKALVLDFLSWNNVLITGIIIGTIGQIGDLVESLIKRDSEVKDSSSLIPGHGGFFDRFDSLLFSSPAIWIYFKYFS